MTSPTPDEAASALVKAWLESDDQGHGGLTSAISLAISTAVKAERERCITILRREMTPSWLNTCSRIERALRGRDG